MENNHQIITNTASGQVAMDSFAVVLSTPPPPTTLTDQRKNESEITAVDAASSSNNNSKSSPPSPNQALDDKLLSRVSSLALSLHSRKRREGNDGTKASLLHSVRLQRLLAYDVVSGLSSSSDDDEDDDDDDVVEEEDVDHNNVNVDWQFFHNMQDTEDEDDTSFINRCDDEGKVQQSNLGAISKGKYNDNNKKPTTQTTTITNKDDDSKIRQQNVETTTTTTTMKMTRRPPLRYYCYRGDVDDDGDDDESSRRRYERFENIMNRRNVINTKLNKYIDSHRSSSSSSIDKSTIPAGSASNTDK